MAVWWCDWWLVMMFVYGDDVDDIEFGDDKVRNDDIKVELSRVNMSRWK